MITIKFSYPVCFFLFLFLSHTSQANSIDQLVDFLKKSRFKGVLSFGSNARGVFDVPQQLKCYEARHHYIWDGVNMVTMLDGTGVLLQYDNAGQFKRLDSTCYEGYNFGAFNFNYRDTLFSIGGYGFWQFNGMVRYFDKKNAAWAIYPTNKIVPIRQWFSSHLYYDLEDSKVYALYMNPADHALVSTGTIDKNSYVQCFDLVTKKWWDEAKVFNSNLLPIIDWSTSSGCFHTQWGRVLRIENDLFVLDFKNVRLSKIAPLKKIEIQHAIDMFPNELFFSKGDKLYFFKTTNAVIDSIQLKETDLVEISGNLYFDKKSRWSDGIRYSTLGILVLIAGLIFFGFRKKIFFPKAKAAPIVIGDTMPSTPFQNEPVIDLSPVGRSSFKETLTETEKSLLELIVSNTLNEKRTTAIQMNHVLGIAKKPVKIQNNIRASTIMMINKKFMVYSGLGDDLIVKERTDFDKRIFEFSIERKYLVKVK